MTVLYSERESVGTKAQFVTLTQQTDDNRQVVVGSDRPLNVVDVNHQRLHEGRAYGAYNIRTHANMLPAGESISIVLASAPGVSPHLSIGQASSGDALFELYENTVSTGGTAFTPIARNRVSTNTSDVAMVLNPTITTAGTLLWTENIVGGTGKKSSGGSGETLEYFLKPLTNYMIRVTNVNSADHTAFIGLEWYE